MATRTVGLVLLVGWLAWGCSDDDTTRTTTTNETPPPTSPTALPTDASFVHGGLRCMFAPDGELTSCEEVSEAGRDAPSAEENCAMLGARLEPGACPTTERVGRCLALDGPDLRPVYPIRVSYYQSVLVADASRAARICADLGGTRRGDAADEARADEALPRAADDAAGARHDHGAHGTTRFAQKMV